MILLEGEKWICPRCSHRNKLEIGSPSIVCEQCCLVFSIHDIDIDSKSALNSQEGGDHYKKLGEYQPWVVLSKWMTPEELKGAMKKDVIAYLCRESDKGGRKDIKKAHHTLGMYLELTGG